MHDYEFSHKTQHIKGDSQQIVGNWIAFVDLLDGSQLLQILDNKFQPKIDEIVELS